MFFHVCKNTKDFVLKSGKGISLHKSKISFAQSYKLLILDKRTKKTRHGRAACTASLQKGSLTIEASLVLPLFLFFLVGMLQFARGVQTESQVRLSLFEAAKKLATYSYLDTYGEDMGSESVLSGAISTVYLHSVFLQQEGKEFWDNSMVSGGSKGFSFLSSAHQKHGGYMDLVVTYKLEIPFPLTGSMYVPQLQRCRVRGWIGESEEEEDDEKSVYITEGGSVYHTSRNCSHLSLTIQEIMPGNLALARNGSGGRYVPCEKCGKKPMEGKAYYITKEGDCFHTTRSCSGLKRTIFTIPLSRIGERSLCRRCGG